MARIGRLVIPDFSNIDLNCLRLSREEPTGLVLQQQPSPVSCRIWHQRSVTVGKQSERDSASVLFSLGANTIERGFEQYEAASTSIVTLICNCCTLLTCVLHADNQLSGTLPSFAAAPYLKDVILANNHLTGTVPSTLFSLPQAYRIDLVTLSSSLAISCQPIRVPSAAFIFVFAGG